MCWAFQLAAQELSEFLFWRGCRGRTLEAISFSPLRCPGNIPIPPVLRYAIHGAQDTSAVRARRTPLRGLEKMPTQRLNKKKRYPLSRIPFLFV